MPPSNGLQAALGGGWNVVVPRDRSYNFDAAVIAHNGKCAERLTSSTPAKEARGREGRGCWRFAENVENVGTLMGRLDEIES